VRGGVVEPAGNLKIEPRLPDIDEHVHDSAAGSDFLLIEVSGEIDFGETRPLPFVEQEPRFAEYFGFAASAADRAELAVGTDDHLRANLARRRAADIDHGCEGELGAGFQRANGLAPDLIRTNHCLY
jgi:hypothetical protein